MKLLRFCIFLVIILSGCKEQELPTVTTGNISSITQTSALCKGYLFSQGSCEVISKGICWNTSGEPTEYDNTITVDSSTSFTIQLVDLTLNTKYYVRAFATNCLGTSYGETKSFSTDPPYIPKVKSYGIPSTTKTSATTGGIITSDGAAEITDRGITWSKSQYPDSTELIANKTSSGSQSETFYVTLTGLDPNSDYFVWAYATNIAGTGYSEPRLITTKFEPDPNLPLDPLYPSAFYKLDSMTLLERIEIFKEKNKYIGSTLNDFGFCTGSGTHILPPYQNEMTQQDAIETVKSFALLNSEETGIENPDDLTFTWITSPPASTSKDYLWILETSPQNIDMKEVINSKIYFWVINSEVVQCLGNWYPQIYVPQNYFVDQEQAKSLLIGRIVSHLGFSGDEYYVKILSEYLSSSSAKLSIVPFIQNDRIEVRITWEIFVPHASYKLYVDVMTGEIVYMEPTVIS